MKDNFKIYSICVVKNEADIIEHCLREAAKWSDYIYVYDGESTDGTWEKVLAMQSETIIPWKRHDKVFHDCLRGEVYNAFKHQASLDDWWCRLDADEFYVDSPREFLKKVKPYHHVVWGIAIDYYLTYENNDSLDFTQPIPQLLPQLKHYQVEHSEAKFFRHRSGLVWHDEHAALPKHMGVVNKERILYRHYKYRTPAQIQTRLDTRRESKARGSQRWSRAIAKHWKDVLINGKESSYDDQTKYHIDTAKLPKHIEPLPKRTMKKLMHGVGIWS